MWSLDSNGALHCSIVMATVPLTHLNKSSLRTVPRIERNAARLAVELYQKIVSEIQFNYNSIYFCCDSITVISWGSGRFQLRVPYIGNHANVDQSRFLNPADLVCRGTLWYIQAMIGSRLHRLFGIVYMNHIFYSIVIIIIIQKRNMFVYS